MTYNITALQGAKSLFTVVQAANIYSEGLLMILFLVAIFFIVLMKSKTYEFSKSLLVASAISFVVSIFLAFAKLINPIWVLVFLIATAFTILFGSIFE